MHSQDWQDRLDCDGSLEIFEEIYSVEVTDHQFATVAVHGWVDVQKLPAAQQELAERTEVDGFAYCVWEFHFSPIDPEVIDVGRMCFPTEIPRDMTATPEERRIVANEIRNAHLCEVAA